MEIDSKVTRLFERNNVTAIRSTPSLHGPLREYWLWFVGFILISKPKSAFIKVCGFAAYLGACNGLICFLRFISGIFSSEQHHVFLCPIGQPQYGQYYGQPTTVYVQPPMSSGPFIKRLCLSMCPQFDGTVQLCCWLSCSAARSNHTEQNGSEALTLFR
jgi:hypothetical protein